MKIEKGGHIDAGALDQLDTRHAMYLIGEDFVAAEVLMAELCSDEWDVLCEALGASRVLCTEEMMAIQKDAKATLKAMCSRELNPGNIVLLLDEVNATIGLAAKAVMTNCDRLETHKKEFLDDFTAMGARRLHSCLEVVAKRVGERKYARGEGVSDRQHREQQRINSMRATEAESEPSDDGDKEADAAMLEMFMADASRLTRQNEAMRKALEEVQQQAAEAKAALEENKKIAGEQLMATKRMCGELQRVVDETREDAAREHAQKMDLNEMLRQEMERCMELQARVAELENDTRAASDIERLRAELEAEHAAVRRLEEEESARKLKAQQAGVARSLLLFRGLVDGAEVLAKKVQADQMSLLAGAQMHKFLNKARAKLQLNEKMAQKQEAAPKSELAQMVSASTGPTAKEVRLEKEIEELIREIEKPDSIDSSTQTAPLPRSLPPPRVATPVAAPRAITPKPPAPRPPDPATQVMWVNSHERCRTFTPSVGGFRRPRSLAGFGSVASHNSQSSIGPMNSVSSIHSATGFAATLGFAGRKLPTLPARFGGVRSTEFDGGGIQFGRESATPTQGLYNLSKMTGTPHCIYYNSNWAAAAATARW